MSERGMGLLLLTTKSVVRRPLGWMCCVAAVAAACASLGVTLAGCDRANTGEMTIRDVVWMDSSRSLAVAVMEERDKQPLQSWLYLVSTDGSGQQRFHVPDGVIMGLSPWRAGHRLLFGFRYSDPQGEIAWARGADIGVSDLHTAPRLLGYPGFNVLPDCNEESGEVAFYHVPPLSEERPWEDIPEGPGIWVTEVGSPGLGRRLTRPGARAHEADGGPHWSPNGSAIAFLRIRLYSSPSEPEDERDLWLVLPDGSEERQVTTLGDFAPYPLMWSQDGQSVAFLRSGRGTGSRPPLSLWSVDVLGKHLRRILSWEDLLSPDDARDVVLSPGFTRLAIRRGSETMRPMELWVIEAETGARTRLDSADDIGPLAWSPDGERLAYARDRTDLCIADWDGRGRWESRHVWSVP